MRLHLDNRKRIFYNYDTLLTFLNRNKGRIGHMKVTPPALGSKGFGSVEVELKSNNKIVKSTPEAI